MARRAPADTGAVDVLTRAAHTPHRVELVGAECEGEAGGGRKWSGGAAAVSRRHYERQAARPTQPAPAFLDACDVPASTASAYRQTDHERAFLVDDVAAMGARDSAGVGKTETRAAPVKTDKRLERLVHLAPS